jgi:hypothetical protein
MSEFLNFSLFFSLFVLCVYQMVIFVSFYHFYKNQCLNLLMNQIQKQLNQNQLYLKYKIQSCNAVSGEGVSEGFEWLIGTIL